MAAEINTLNINGKLVSWSHVRLTFAGDLFTGFTSISWDQKRERVFGYGATKAHGPIGVSEGKYTPGAVKIKGHVHAIAQLRKWWADRAEDGKSYGDTAPLLGQLQWDLGTGAEEQVVEFRNLTWREESNSAEENPDPEMEEITLQPEFILRNGLTLYNSIGQV